MAKATEGPTGESPPEEEAVADPKGAMDRLAELTRRVMAVPKTDLNIPPSSPVKKRGKKKRRH